MIVKLNQLDTPFNEIYGEGDNYSTPREFITDTEERFNLPFKNLGQITDKKLNEYIEYLDNISHNKAKYLK